MIRPILCFRTSDAASAALTAVRAEGAEVEAEIREIPARKNGHAYFSINLLAGDEGRSVAAIKEQSLDNSAVHCPSCRSVNVEFPATPKGSGIFRAVESMLESIPSSRSHFFCHHCNYTWEE